MQKQIRLNEILEKPASELTDSDKAFVWEQLRQSDLTK
jgi:hypothetical protein